MAVTTRLIVTIDYNDSTHSKPYTVRAEVLDHGYPMYEEEAQSTLRADVAGAAEWVKRIVLAWQLQELFEGGEYFAEAVANTA